MIQGIKGTPAEPKPGSGSDVMPTYAKHREDMKTVNYEKAPELEKAVRPAYIYKNDVMEHGATAGCKACSIAMNRGNTTGYTHSPACRMRFEEIFKNLGSEKLKRADARIDRAVYEASVGAEAPAAAPEEEKMDEDESGTAADPPAPEPIPPVPPQILKRVGQERQVDGRRVRVARYLHPRCRDRRRELVLGQTNTGAV